MRILFIGVFHKPWSTTIPMAYEFNRRKNKVITFDFRIKSKKKSNLNKKFIDLIKKKVTPLFKTINYIDKYYFHGNWRINRQLIYELENNNYDLVFLVKANTINYNLIPRINKCSKTWFFYMDPLNTTFKDNGHKYAKLCTWSSATFSSVNAFFRRNGANSCFLTQGCNTSVFKPSNSNKKKIEVLFVGSFSLKRKKYISFLKRNNINVICYGTGWNNRPIYLKELTEEYQNAKIILNFTRSNIGFSIRIFQAMGTGSFLLSEYCQDLDRIFRKGIHLEWFKTQEELLKKIQYYLENDEAREKISKQGFNYVIKNFTWDKIIDRILWRVNKNTVST